LPLVHDDDQVGLGDQGVRHRRRHVIAQDKAASFGGRERTRRRRLASHGQASRVDYDMVQARCASEQPGRDRAATNISGANDQHDARRSQREQFPCCLSVPLPPHCTQPRPSEKSHVHGVRS
jgi:hypothetical protein